jgi:hypothetical protein
MRGIAGIEAIRSSYLKEDKRKQGNIRSKKTIAPKTEEEYRQLGAWFKGKERF